jgi:hypothetical protein
MCPLIRFPGMKPWNLGRVKSESGLIAIVDRNDLRARPVELGGEPWHAQVVRREFSEGLLGHRCDARVILLPTGYGPGHFTVVASFWDNRLMEFAMCFPHHGRSARIIHDPQELGRKTTTTSRPGTLARVSADGARLARRPPPTPKWMTVGCGDPIKSEGLPAGGHG